MTSGVYLRTQEYRQAIKCKELWNVGNGISLCEECHCNIDESRQRFLGA